MKQFDEEETIPEQEQVELLTVKELAKALRWDETTVRRHIKDGTIEAITLPHPGNRLSYRIRRTTLDKILEGNAS